MADAIFLSASVPDPKKAPEFAETADPVAITAAVSALVYVTLGRRRLVWGGHPAITPMIWLVAQELEVDYGSWVTLYQSRYFEDEYPEDNARFNNVIYTEPVDGDLEKSLLAMRVRMLSDNSLFAAVFIGGMGGVVSEFELVRQLQPTAHLIPVASTGGAALTITHLAQITEDLRDDLDYISLFHRQLAISVREERFRRPQDQPLGVEERYWKRDGH